MRAAVLQLLFAALLWSTGGVLIKAVDWTPLAIAGTRSAIATFTLLLLIRRPHFHFSRTQCLAAIFYAGTVILFVVATRLTTAANAIFLQYTAPIYIALLAGVVVGEKPSRADWVLTGVAVAGVGLFFLDQLSARGWPGIVVALASGLCFAGLSLTMRLQKRGSPLESVILGNALATVLCLPAMLSSGPPPGTHPWLVLLLLGVFQLAIAYWFYARAIRHLRALQAIIITTCEPVLNPLWVLLVLGERPGRWSLIGGTIVILAALSRSLQTPRDAPAVQPC